MTSTGAAARSARLLTALVRGGVREFVLSPGSRSAPMALPLHAADAARDVRLHVRVDERSAGFLALGLSIGSRQPVAVVTTSGTAVGNLVPAVMEAHHAGRCLVVVSADRPDSLRGTGANQTTEQAGLFGGFAPCFDLGGSATDAEIDGAAAGACQRLGPTQLNVQLDDPLLPPVPLGRLTPLATSAEKGVPTLLSADTRGGGRRLERGPRTVVVAGDEAGPAARRLAERGGWPLLAEPTSGARVGPNAIRTYRLLLGADLGADLGAQVERVVVLGHPTLSRPVTALISRPDIQVYASPGPGGIVTDPGGVAIHLTEVPTVDGPPTDAELDWLAAWQAADKTLSSRLDTFVDTIPALDALQVAREVADAVVAGATLVVGSSNPVRDLDIMTTPYPAHERRRIVGNRGLAGIDGTVSTAIGVALGRPQASRSIALLGDVTFLHDANGLVLGPDEPRPDLTFVVVNDDGGSIFSTLEQGAPDYADAFERVFGTPHGVDLEALCAASHTAYERVGSVAELRHTLADPPPGMRVVEARVSRTARRAQAAAVAALVKD